MQVPVYFFRCSNPATNPRARLRRGTIRRTQSLCFRFVVFRPFPFCCEDSPSKLATIGQANRQSPVAVGRTGYQVFISGVGTGRFVGSGSLQSVEGPKVPLSSTTHREARLGTRVSAHPPDSPLPLVVRVSPYMECCVHCNGR